MNKRGVYPPNQINAEVEKQWGKHVDSDTNFATKEQVKQITTKTINNLGSKGNGITFNEDVFTK